MLPNRLTAFFTFMGYDKTIAIWFGGGWHHHTATIGRAVARVVINMARPQTFRTMICITITKNHRATMGAFKIFDGFGEFFHLITDPVHSDTFGSIHLFHPIRLGPFYASVSFDGDAYITVHSGDRIVVEKSDKSTKIIKLSGVSFLEILRQKMAGS